MQKLFILILGWTSFPVYLFYCEKDSNNRDLCVSDILTAMRCCYVQQPELTTPHQSPLFMNLINLLLSNSLIKPHPVRPTRLVPSFFFTGVIFFDPNTQATGETTPSTPY